MFIVGVVQNVKMSRIQRSGGQKTHGNYRTSICHLEGLLLYYSQEGDHENRYLK